MPLGMIPDAITPSAEGGVAYASCEIKSTPMSSASILATFWVSVAVQMRTQEHGRFCPVPPPLHGAGSSSISAPTLEPATQPTLQTWSPFRPLLFRTGCPGELRHCCAATLLQPWVTHIPKRKRLKAPPFAYLAMVTRKTDGTGQAHRLSRRGRSALLCKTRKWRQF